MWARLNVYNFQSWLKLKTQVLARVVSSAHFVEYRTVSRQTNRFMIMCLYVVKYIYTRLIEKIVDKDFLNKNDEGRRRWVIEQGKMDLRVIVNNYNSIRISQL